MGALQDAVINLLVVVVGLVASYLAKEGAGFLKAQGLLKKLENKKKYVEIVVKATQQIYQEADGAVKLEEAKKELVEIFNKNGLPCTEDELNMLIESAVKGMNEGLKEGVEA